MSEQISWGQSGINARIAVVELCGWRNKSGKATPTGLKIAKTEWIKLSTATTRVLSKSGVTA